MPLVSRSRFSTVPIFLGLIVYLYRDISVKLLLLRSRADTAILTQAIETGVLEEEVAVELHTTRQHAAQLWSNELRGVAGHHERRLHRFAGALRVALPTRPEQRRAQGAPARGVVRWDLLGQELGERRHLT